jgi:hypothetical protein
MFARGFVVLGNLGVRKAHPVLAVTAGTALQGGDHFYNRQDLSARSVRLCSTFDLGDPLIERSCTQPAQSRGSSDSGVANESIPGKYFTPASRQRRLKPLTGALLTGALLTGALLGRGFGTGSRRWTRCLGQSRRRAGQPNIGRRQRILAQPARRACQHQQEWCHGMPGNRHSGTGCACCGPL